MTGKSNIIDDKIHKKGDPVIKKMLSDKEHKSLKLKVKKAKEDHKKSESQVKAATKVLTTATKVLKKATEQASSKKTAAAKKAKLQAADNVNKAKTKLKEMTLNSKEKAYEIKLAQTNLVDAEKNEIAWQKAAAAFEKRWEREYDKKQKKKDLR